MQQQINQFLDELVNEINTVGIDVSNLTMDHIAYSASSTKEYEELVPKYLAEGILVMEVIIDNRRIALIKLNNPIIYKDQSIEVMEIIEPIEGKQMISGWEHVEFLVSNYDELLNKYPTLSWNTKHKDRENFSRLKLVLPSGREVKFINTPVLESAKLEK